MSTRIRKSKSAKQPSPPGSVFRLKIALEWLKPQIWLRIEIPDCTLDLLHEAIQRVVPWDSSHLWCFVVGKTRYIDPEFMDFPGDRPADQTRLGQLHAAGVRKFVYEYDFGDSWAHRLTIEKVVPREAGAKYPKCVGGERACPPDDCGGFPGYEQLLDILADSTHPEHEDMIDWLGGPIDPEVFPLDAVDKDLRKLKL